MDIKEEKKPLVSVVMPACNAERFVEEAVMSVLGQTVSDLELIVVDDGSSDETRQILGRIAEQDARVRLVVNEENMGVAKSRNRGLDLSRGTYTALLDSDDYWHSDMLEKMIACIERTGADLVYCSYAMVDEDGKKICNDFIVPETADYAYSLVRSVITCSTVLMTRKIVDAYRFPTNVYHEDIAMWFTILKEGGTACGVTEILAAYRQRSGSRSSEKLKSASRRWEIYHKHLGIGAFRSIVLMIRYGIYGLAKYKRL
ncbi:MAG: glycosyltransferase [Oscillospiraceae bacterium]|nr:glycosyltransferase [Oscillospiraceae bacterium]